ncbi:related to flagellar biosynthesis protein (FlhG) [Desulfotalea psychrophila LSv54]|uniref:Related to flagellar biosynthesis protein (FlhG) n=2 Tax=Desulfotalea psychrophila TaxID=84980 RepID=Q6AJS4_DESPS|nr:related to flagellar biosynthesis protein (FlhG) [Desulfotalea psychrophila LSv54]
MQNLSCRPTKGPSMLTSYQETNDQAGTLRSISPQQPNSLTARDTTVYSITSGKGGVGKTAITANLAYSLALCGKKVLILDADLGLANIDVVFGLTPRYNLNHFFAGEQDLESILIEGPLGIQILPAGSGIPNFTHLSSDLKRRLLQGLDAMHSRFDYVLIDTEAGISDNVTYFNTTAQEIMVITTPEPTAITDAYALMKLLSTQFHEKKFNLVVNQIESEDDALDVYRKLTLVSNRYLDISIDYLGSIPQDRQMIDAIRRQRVLSELQPGSKVATSFSRLAGRICVEPNNRHHKGNVQFFWQRLLNFGTGE